MLDKLRFRHGKQFQFRQQSTKIKIYGCNNSGSAWFRYRKHGAGFCLLFLRVVHKSLVATSLLCQIKKKENRQIKTQL